MAFILEDAKGIGFEDLTYEGVFHLWNSYGIYFKMVDAGFELMDFYFENTDEFDLPDNPVVLAAAMNLILSEYNKDTLLDCEFIAFEDPMKVIGNEYSVEASDVLALSEKIREKMEEQDFDETLLAYNPNGEQDEEEHYDEDDDEFEGLNFIFDNHLYHVKLIDKRERNLTDNEIFQIFEDAKQFIIEKNEIEFPNLQESMDIKFQLFQIVRNDNEITFSVEITAILLIKGVEIIEEILGCEPNYKLVGTSDYNLHTPNMQYAAFMELYRDFNTEHIKTEKELKNYTDRIMKLTHEERHKENKNAREDDEYGAIKLFDLPKEESILAAQQILVTNPNNIEAKLVIAGWEMDLEKRIDILLDATNPAFVSFDYQKIDKDHMWWGVSETRPFMRAKLLLGNTYEQGFYKDDAIDTYEELLEMNKNDNQGVRELLIKLYYQENNKKGISTLLNDYPDEKTPLFAFARAHFTFLKFGKGNKSEKAIENSINSNPIIACDIVDLDYTPLLDSVDLPKDEIKELKIEREILIDLIEILFKNIEFKKYYKKMVERVLD